MYIWITFVVPISQDYQTWCDLRQLEENVGQRYLSHESDDERWEQFRRERNLARWQDTGMKGVNETYKLGKSRSERTVNASSWICVVFLVFIF